MQPSLGTSSEEHTVSDALTYAGLVLLAFELLKEMIVRPIKYFYMNTTFSGGPFVSYERDVLSKHKSEFEACLMYLRDFMEAIDEDDVKCVQDLRNHRNEIAHDLPTQLLTLRLEDYAELFRATDRTMFKLSNYRTRMEFGADPAYKNQGIEWNTVKGPRYELYEEVLSGLETLRIRLRSDA